MLKNDAMISGFPVVESKPVFFTYPTLRFHIHLLEDSVSTINLAYDATLGELRREVSVVTYPLTHLADACERGFQPARAGNGRRGAVRR